MVDEKKKSCVLRGSNSKLKQQRRKKANRRLFFCCFVFYVDCLYFIFPITIKSCDNGIKVSGNHVYRIKTLLQVQELSSDTNIWKVEGTTKLRKTE